MGNGDDTILNTGVMGNVQLGSGNDTYTVGGFESGDGTGFAGTVRGGSGEDTMTGGTSDDFFYGGVGNDRMEGGDAIIDLSAIFNLASFDGPTDKGSVLTVSNVTIEDLDESAFGYVDDVFALG